MSFAVAQPVTLPFSGQIAPNRFLKAPMEELLATFDEHDEFQRGRPTSELISLYRQYGKASIGVIVSGNIMVHRHHLGRPKDIIIDYENPNDYTEDLAKVATAAKAHGSLILGQLNHPGRQGWASLQPNLVSASNVPIGAGKAPSPLTLEGIQDVIKRFAFAAEVLYKAAFDGVELHAAHGYLLTQFLSPKTNLRTDQYGGSLENRARIIFEIISAIRQRIPDPSFVLSIKLNTADFSEGGFSFEDSHKLAFMLEAVGIDLIELSGGTYEELPWLGSKKGDSTRKREAYFLDFASKLRPQLKKTMLAVSGGFRSFDVMNNAVANGETDFIGLARPLAAEPYLIRDMLNGTTNKAIANLVPSKLSVVAAFPQLAQIANELPIWDYSQEKWVQEFISYWNFAENSPKAVKAKEDAEHVQNPEQAKL